MKRRFFLVTATALGGCSLLPSSPYVQRRDWPLDVHRDATLPARQRGKVLLVRAIRAAPGLDVRGMQWLESDGSVDHDDGRLTAVLHEESAINLATERNMEGESRRARRTAFGV